MWARLTGKKKERATVEVEQVEDQLVDAIEEEYQQRVLRDSDRELEEYLDEEEGAFVNADRIVSSFEYDSDEENELKEELNADDPDFMDLQGMSMSSFELDMIEEGDERVKDTDSFSDDETSGKIVDDDELLSYADTLTEERSFAQDHLETSTNLLPSPAISPAGSKDEDDIDILGDPQHSDDDMPNASVFSDKTIKRSNSSQSDSKSRDKADTVPGEEQQQPISPSQSVESMKKQVDDALEQAKSRRRDLSSSRGAAAADDRQGNPKEYTMEEVQTLLSGLERQVKRLSTQVQDLEAGKTTKVGIKVSTRSNGNDDASFQLDKDTFALLMRSDVCSWTWLFGLAIYICQVGLISLICISNLWLIDTDSDDNDTGANLRTPFNIPLSVSTTVRIAQFFAILLCLLARQEFISAILVLCIDTDFAGHDICTSFLLLCMDCDRGDSSWHRLIETHSLGPIPRPGTADFSEANDGDNGNAKGGRIIQQHGCGLRFRRFVIPMILKLIKGVLTLFVSMWIIIRSTDVLTLVKDLSAIMVLSSVDYFFYILVVNGYFGQRMQIKARECENILVRNATFSIAGLMKTTLRGILLFLTLAGMATGWAFVVRGQISGAFLHKAYPDCDINAMIVGDAVLMGNGRCDLELNTPSCNFDAGDCREFNSDEYEDCRATFNASNETGLDPSRLGDGMCHNEWPYNTRACRYDGFDCLVMVEKQMVETQFEVPGYPGCRVTDIASALALGDGNCNAMNNSTECQWDGGDCVEAFRRRHIPGLPGCIAFVEWIGDGICNPTFNTTECVNDGGDCLI